MGETESTQAKGRPKKQHVSNPFLSPLEFDSFLVNISPETLRRYPALLMTTCCLTIDPHHRFRPPSRLCVRAAAVWQSNRHLCLYLILLSYPSPSTLRVPGAAGGPSPPRKGRRDGETEEEGRGERRDGAPLEIERQPSKIIKHFVIGFSPPTISQVLPLCPY